MMDYRMAGQEFHLSCPVLELEPYRIPSTNQGIYDRDSRSFGLSGNMIARTTGFVSGAPRQVEVYDTSGFLMLKVDGCGEYFISRDGGTIGKMERTPEFNRRDRDVITGPALVLALALKGTWCLHASASVYQENVFVFLGESGQGKSTLTGYLSHSPGWRLVADDILPVTLEADGLFAWPHFPQLKLPVEAQPGPGLPERIVVKKLFVLADENTDEQPALQPLAAGASAQMLLRHTAGTRMFSPELLAGHLEFCALAVKQKPIFKLVYPHRKNILPRAREILEESC